MIFHQKPTEFGFFTKFIQSHFDHNFKIDQKFNSWTKLLISVKIDFDQKTFFAFKTSLFPKHSGNFARKN